MLYSTKKAIGMALILALVIAVVLSVKKLAEWWNEPYIVQAPKMEPLPEDAMKAIKKCGPYYVYRFHADTKQLEVNIDGEWLNLKY